MFYSNLFYLVNMLDLVYLVFLLDFFYWLFFFLQLFFWNLWILLFLLFLRAVLSMIVLHLCPHSFFFSPIALKLIILLEGDVSYCFNFMIKPILYLNILKLRYRILIYSKSLFSQITLFFIFQIFYITFFGHLIEVCINALNVSFKISFSIGMFYRNTLREIDYS
jgi:hypothetical protein